MRCMVTVMHFLNLHKVRRENVGQVACDCQPLLNELNARHMRDVGRMMDGKDGLAAIQVARRYAMRL
jgi:hypothetical protein